MGIRLIALAFVSILLPGMAGAQVKYIDVHAHLHPFVTRDFLDYVGAARAAVSSMDEFGAARMIVLPPPMASGMPLYDADELIGATKPFPGRFAVVGGGGSLNPMIMDAVRAGKVDDSAREKFAATAERLAAMPIVGFGEFTAEHFSLGPNHIYLSAPADHPLFLLLADIAAKHDLPIDLHMEAIEHPAKLASSLRSPPNPSSLVPNIPNLERLLDHNKKTRIVWQHVGWDHTGQRTPALTRRLLAAHPNLYVATKLGPDSPPENRVADRDHGVRPEWLAVMEEFPDRFLVATDQFHTAPGSQQRFPRHPGTARLILDSLPPALAQRIGVDNPLAVYPRLRQ